MRFYDDQGGIWNELNLIDPKEVPALYRHGNGMPARGMEIKSLAILPEPHVGKGEGKIIVLPLIHPIDKRVVGKIEQDDQVPVGTSFGPNAILFHAVGKSLFVVGTRDIPVVGTVSSHERDGQKPDAEERGKQSCFHTTT